MPNNYIENRDRWELLSQVDYLAAFANAWLAFNAWYRSAYQENRDRTIIRAFKNNPNVARNSLLPMLTSNSEEGEQFRANIGLLHHRLENHHLHNTWNGQQMRITLTNIYLRDNVPAPQRTIAHGISYEVIPTGNQIICTLTAQDGTQFFNLTQPNYDLAGLESDQNFINNLSQPQQGRLLSLYRILNPRCIANLLDNGQPPIECGAYQFRCTSEDLFAGVVEAIYLMRCTFFHGELVPSREAALCYEPAYHLVRRFLQSIT